MVSAITVNGTRAEVTAPAATPLLWVLREFGLTAAKYGCGLDQCGACTVLVGQRAVASCQLTIDDVGEQDVTTLEALVGTPAGERVVAALTHANAGQCGFCLPGIAVTLISLAQRGDALSRPDLARELDSHLCRCGSQPRILTAGVAALAAAADGDDD